MPDATVTSPRHLRKPSLGLGPPRSSPRRVGVLPGADRLPVATGQSWAVVALDDQGQAVEVIVVFATEVAAQAYAVISDHVGEFRTVPCRFFSQQPTVSAPGPEAV